MRDDDPSMMKTEIQIRDEGLYALVKQLGMIDAERFISLILRDRFDYTEWQRHLWENDSLETIYERAAAGWEAHERPVP